MGVTSPCSEYSELFSTYVYLVENHFFAQSYYSTCNLPFEACVVAELLVVPRYMLLKATSTSCQSSKKDGYQKNM